ncbi:twin-arginine translocation signal domain-containing protein [Halocatena marina]|uniref:twin-arginine translocation signal domain-containing protein n=1 Tax=Halocatena marina TaxID=2934937 RepID=UPI002225248B|nr:twin-arginine translocation signal domain-containing protein [Halocatena marina]
MRENQSTKRTRKYIDRRTLLKTGAVGAAGLAMGSGFASARLESNDEPLRGSNVHTVTSSGGAEISEKQRHEIRTRAVRDYEQKNGRSVDAIGVSKPQANESNVVAYAYGLDANGRAHSYVGLAGEDTTRAEMQSGRAEALIHNRFDRRVSELSSNIKASEQQVTTMAGGTVTDTENMEQFGKFDLEYASDPYGVVGMTNYWFKDTTNSSEADAHAFHTPAGYEPGTQAFGSEYKNDWGRVFHRWNKCEMGNTNLDYGQWQPYGTKSGSTTQGYSVSVSVGYETGYATAGLSWSYSQPNVEVVDESSAYNTYNQWHLKLNSDWDDDTRTNFIGFQPSSTVSTDDWESSMGEKDICELEVKARFDNGYSHFRRLRTWNTYKIVPA